MSSSLRIGTASAPSVPAQADELLISVLLPTFQGHAWIADCLDSLAAQTLPAARFEVLVLHNGPATGTERIVADWQARHPRFAVRYLEVEGVGAANARNHGLDHARGRYVVFVDDDDRAGPDHLRALLAAGNERVVSGTYVGEVREGDFARPSFNHDYTRTLAAQRTHQGDGTPLNIMAGSVWAKLLSTELARATRFDTELVLGSDTEFMCRYVAEHEVTFRVAEGEAASAYFVQLRSGSLMTHGERISQVNVAHRLKVLRALEAITPSTELGRVAIDGHIFGQWLLFLRDYATQSPAERAEIEDAVLGLGLREQHWRLLRQPVERVTHDVAWPVILQTLDVIAQAKGRADELWEANVRPYLTCVPDDLRPVTAEARKRRITAPWDRIGSLKDVDLNRAQISVVVPCYRAAPFILECLDSLGAQSILPRAFEVVLVLNGPDDGAAELISAWAHAHPEIRLQVLESEATGAAAARNAGLAAVTAPYVTFVDSDDTVRPHYLASLLAELGPGVIAAVLEEEYDDGKPDTLTFDHAVGVQGIVAAARHSDLEEVSWYLRPVWAKAVATADARAIGFPEDMATEEDTVFWFRLYAQGRHRIQVGGGGIESAYVYRRRLGSLVARGEKRTWESTVAPSILTLARLKELRGTVRFEKVRDEHVRMLTERFFADLLRENPEYLDPLLAELERHGLGGLDLRPVLAQMPRELVLLGGPSGAAALGTAPPAGAVDAFTLDAGQLDSPGAAAGHVVVHAHLAGVGGAWSELAEALGAVASTIKQVAPVAGYTGLTSASSEPLVDLLAALVSLENPTMTWTSVRVARENAQAVVPDALFDRLTAALVQRGYPHDSVPETTDGFADLIVDWLADRIVASDGSVVERAGTEPDEDAGAGPLLTVVVPTYQGEHRIATCLDRLAAQTLPHHLFEVVVVQNGPVTGTPEVVRAWSAEHPDVEVRLIETDVASAQNARNLVLDGETADWVAFIDDDDHLQPRYLEALWDAAAPGRIPFGRVGLVVEGREHEIHEETWLNAVPRQFLGRPATNAELWPAINPAWGKIAERSVIGDVRFDTTLRYADDTVFWMEVLARSGASLTLTDFRDDSMYLWVQRDGSITRSGADDWTVHVERKLSAIAAMQRVAGEGPDQIAACDAVCALFWPGITAYADGYPQHRRRTLSAVRSRGLARVPAEVTARLTGAVITPPQPRSPGAPAASVSSGAGAAVAHVGSPLQALNLLEYCQVTDITPALVLVGDCANDTTLQQTRAVLAELADVPVLVRQCSGGWLTPDATTPAAFDELGAALRQVGPVTRFILGEYRLPALWQLINALGISGHALIVLDDGASALSMDRPAQLAASTAEGDLAGPDHRPGPSATFFTVYPDQLAIGPEDHVVVNRQTRLRAGYSALDVAADLVFVIGQPLSEAGVVDHGDLDLALGLIAEAQAWRPEATVVYVSHRREREQKLAAIREVCEVFTFDLPFEMVPIQLGILPGGVVGNYSTLLGNLAELAGTRIAVRAHRLPDVVIAERFVPGITRMYAELAGHPSGAVEVVDHVLATSGSAS